MVPPSSAATLVNGVRPAASLYAVVRSDCACNATASARWVAPPTRPGGKPVAALPGLTPRSWASTLGPVFVTVEPANTEKLPAVPKPTGASAACAPVMLTMSSVTAAPNAPRPASRSFVSRRT